MHSSNFFCTFAAKLILQHNVMKKSLKISLWVIGGLVVLGVLVMTCLDIVVSRIAEKEARKAIAEAQLPYTIEFGRIHVFATTGFVDVEDIHFAANNKSIKGVDTLDVFVPSVTVGHIKYMDLLRKKRVSINAVRVQKACLTYKQKGSKLLAKVDSASVELRDLFYSLKDSTYGYSDSVYEVSVRHASMIMPDGLMAMEVNKLHHEDGGVITLGKTRIHHTVGKRELSGILHEPCSWLDLSLKSVEISPMNPFREDFSKGLHIKQINVVGDKMATLRDARLKPSKPYQMPQRIIMAMGFPIKIDKVAFDMPKLNVEVLVADKNCGELQLDKINATIADFSNKKGSVMKVALAANLGGSLINGDFKMYMNDACRFDMAMEGKNVQASSLTNLLRPLTAIELNCQIDSMRAKYTGDEIKANGTVMMAYHNLQGKVYKADEIPFKIISQNAGAIEYFVNHLIPKSNPRNDSKAPLVFNVEWVRKDDQPFPLYMVGPLIMGAVETFLPGLFGGKKVK